MQKETTRKDQSNAQFERFWNHYPKKVEKAGARAKFDAAVRKGVDPERIIAAAARYAKSDQVARGFVKHPTTWLNQGCWDDELPVAPREPGEALDTSPAAEVRRKMAAAEDSRKALSWVAAGELAIEAERLAQAHGVAIDRVAVQRFKLLARSELARQKGETGRAFDLEREAMALGGGA